MRRLGNVGISAFFGSTGAFRALMRRALPRLAAMALALVLLVSAAPGAASAANVSVFISLSDQKMKVKVNGWTRYRWDVSTARSGYRTPTGTYRPIRLERMWYSHKYHMSPMPYSIFFHGGYAIHGTNAISRLGSRASHGCIRLHPDNAKRLYDLAKTYGSKNFSIVITK